MSVKELQDSTDSIRAPYLRVLVNGIELTGDIEAETESVSHFSADTFRITAALSGLPTDMGEYYWSTSDRDVVQIDFGFRNANGIPVYDAPPFIGVVDDIDIDEAAQILTLSGRDLSGDLFDTKIALIHADQSSSDIATQIAKSHGLTANVAPTSIKNGKIYQQMHVRLSHEQSEWDLLTFLAQQEGFDLWVSGRVLNFLPPVAETEDPYVLWRNGNVANFKNLRRKRSQTLAKDVIVKVRSWNQAQGKTFTATSKVSRAYKSQRAGGLEQTYSFNVPNLDQSQADKWAKAKAEEITKHERVISADLAGDNLLTQRSMIKLVGTKTAWDQAYHVDTISRRMSMNGYEMSVRAKNHSTESTVNL